MVVVGIDPGVSAGYVTLDSDTKKIIDVRWFDGWVYFYRHLKKLNETETIFAAIEKVHVINDDPKTATTFMQNAGGYYSILEALDIMHVRVPPSTWQRAILGNFKKGDSKKRAREVATQKWGPAPFLKTSRSRNPDHNLVDAALIALYASEYF